MVSSLATDTVKLILAGIWNRESDLRRLLGCSRFRAVWSGSEFRVLYIPGTKVILLSQHQYRKHPEPEL